MLHGLAHNRTNGIGFKQGGDPLGVALAECVTGDRGVILPSIVSVGCEHLSIGVGVQQFDQRLGVGGRGFGERTCEFHGNMTVRAGELVIGHAEHVGKIVRSTIGPHGHFIVGNERTHGGNQVAAIFNERTQAIRSFLRCAVERRSHDHLVFGETFGRSVRRHEIAFDVELEQRVVHVAHHVVVLEVATEREARFDEEPVERGK